MSIFAYSCIPGLGPVPGTQLALSKHLLIGGLREGVIPSAPPVTRKEGQCGCEHRLPPTTQLWKEGSSYYVSLQELCKRLRLAVPPDLSAPLV
jgi:hypothetical protein